MLNLIRRGFVKKYLVASLLLGLAMLLGYVVISRGALTDTAQDASAPAPEYAHSDSAVEAADSEVSEPFYTPQTQEASENLGTSNLLADSINAVDHRAPLDPSVRSDPGGRDRVSYDNVIDQFAVEDNPRYKPRDDTTTLYDAYTQGCAADFVGPSASGCSPTFITYCHTFVWDVTRAMGVEVPYWLDVEGMPNELELTEHGWELWLPAYWLSANGMNHWLNEKGSQYGWREVSAEKAQEVANLGHPTVVSVYEPQGFGHIGIVRPGEMLNGPALAQAGITNHNYAHVYDFFPREGTQFFAHD